jgi:hypothetical protein
MASGGLKTFWYRVAGIVRSLKKVTLETETLRQEVAAAAKPSPLRWIAGRLSVIARVIDVIALARRRA